MAHVSAVPALPDVDDLWSLLAFLKDPKAVEKRVKELEGLREEINALIGAAGKAEDIDRLLLQAQSDRQMARETLEAAQREKSAVTESLTAARFKAAAEMDQAHAALAAERAALDQQRRAWEVELATREAAANTAIRDAGRKSDEAAAALDRARRVQEEFQAKLTALKAGLAAVSG